MPPSWRPTPHATTPAAMPKKKKRWAIDDVTDRIIDISILFIGLEAR
jgi:hypothetical protein